MEKVTFDKASFRGYGTIMAELPDARSYQGPLVFNPNTKDIGVLVPRRWRWLRWLLGEKVIILRAGKTLTATSNGRSWRIDR
jgi:hypothetical protein